MFYDDLKILWDLKIFRMCKILWDFISQCETWHVCISHILHKKPTVHKACTLLQWNNEIYKIYTQINLWKFTKSKRFSFFLLVSKQIEKKLWKRVFETNEKWWKLPKSKRFICFKTNWNEVLEMVKVLSAISGVSKHYWNRLKHEENWLGPKVSVVWKQSCQRNTRPHFWCFEVLKQ